MGSFTFVLMILVLMAMLQCSSSHRYRNRLRRNRSWMRHSRFNSQPSIETCLCDKILPILQKKLCPEPVVCENGGTLLPDGTCDCVNGFIGAFCAEMKSCENGGTLLDNGDCECPIGFTGDLCESQTDVCERTDMPDNRCVRECPPTQLIPNLRCPNEGNVCCDLMPSGGK